MSSAVADHYHSVIVGAGPAGTGPLVYGAWSGQLGTLLDRGLAVVESGSSLGPGRLERYAINSNSTGSTFLECLEHGVSRQYLQSAMNSPLKTDVGKYRDSVLPLSLASGLLRSIGDDLLATTTRSPNSHAFLETRAEGIRVLSPGRFEVSLASPEGARRITAGRVLLATGGEPQVARGAGAMLAECVRRNGVRELPMMVSSEELLTETGRAGAEAWLDGYDSPQVIVLGGAHSALSSLWLLLERMSGDFGFAEESLTLLHRSPIKVFYESVEEARSDGFTHFRESDVGKKGQVFPIGGLRGDAKALYRRISGLDSSVREKRVKLAPLPGTSAGWDALGVDWKNLALVVFATGYVQPDLPIHNASGTRIALHGHFTERYVDQEARMLDAFGAPIPGLFATGFTSGFSPVAMLGGEPSYVGKENSVWLCQHLLGEMLFNALTN